MASEFKLFREDGVNLIDSNYINYGLVKSGPMVAAGSRSVPYRDDDGSGPSYYWDMPIHTAKVVGVAPVLFCVGRSILVAINKVGNEWEYVYVGASTATRFYAYDLIREPNPDAIRFRLWKEDGSISFNSRQWPLNIYDAVTLPAPANNTSPYAGGARAGTFTKTYPDNQMYACNIPFNRGAICVASGRDTTGATIGADNECAVTCIEGAWGGRGVAIAGFHSDPNVYPYNNFVGAGLNSTWSGTYTASIPKMLVVDVTYLPYPFAF